MRILLVNKFHYYRGGSEKYYFELGKLLKEHGHTVGYFSMKNENNISTGDEEYFVDETDMNTGSKLKAFDVIYSPANKKLMTKALEEFKPDIVHINNFQRQLSASIVDAIKEKNIPIVMTAHDLNPICPASIMLYKGQICDDCVKNGYMSCIKKSCIKDSKAKSLIGVLEYKFYQAKKVWNKIDLMISPSNFNRNMLVSNGAICKKNITLPNFVNDISNDNIQFGDYAFYLGRLSVEKGIMNIIKSVKDIDNAKLMIAGDGPERENIEKYIKENNLENRITLLGYLNPQEIQAHLSKCKFVIFSSICYENCPYSILETMAAEKATIASDVGGVSELVIDGKNGFLYPFDDIDKLKEKIALLYSNDDLAKELGKNARKTFEENYTSEVYYKKLMEQYSQLTK